MRNNLPRIDVEKDYSDGGYWYFVWKDNNIIYHTRCENKAKQYLQNIYLQDLRKQSKNARA